MWSRPYNNTIWNESPFNLAQYFLSYKFTSNHFNILYILLVYLWALLIIKSGIRNIILNEDLSVTSEGKPQLKKSYFKKTARLLHMKLQSLDTHTLQPSSVFSTDKLLALSTPTLRRFSCLLYLRVTYQSWYTTQDEAVTKHSYCNVHVSLLVLYHQPKISYLFPTWVFLPEDI